LPGRGIETGTQALLLGDEHCASKPARHDIRQRGFGPYLTPNGTGMTALTANQEHA
jgi:hypothetical protein